MHEQGTIRSDGETPADPAADPRLQIRPWIRVLATIGFGVFLFAGIPIILIRFILPSGGREQAFRFAALGFLCLFSIATPLSLWVPGRRGHALKRAAAGLLGTGFLAGAIGTLLQLAGVLPSDGQPNLRILTGLTVVGLPCLIFAVLGKLPSRPNQR